ncbi:MAG TPA: hypothetical protein VLJ76_04110 [Gaiellaceae bacterium]|nr:hypothetical protein [Gaiellaceae bacterium]
MRNLAIVTFALVALLTVPALASTTGSADLLKTFSKQLPAVKRKTSVPILLPSSLPFGAKVPKLYATGTGSKNAWSLGLAGAPNCGGADACFLASFEGKRGGKLPGKSNVKLSGGQPAYYKGVTCGASCSPASLWFTSGGVLYSWQDKDLPANTKPILLRLAAQAIKAGPR